MNKTQISAIASIGKNRELGRNNELIWRIPDDFKRMKELTDGKPIIMGRKTHESIGRPLPNRLNIIITRDKNYVADGCTVVHSLDEAVGVATAFGGDEIFIFGGAQIYNEALPQTYRLYLTIVNDEALDADTFFPPFENEFKEIKRHGLREHDGIKFEWVDFVRKK